MESLIPVVNKLQDVFSTVGVAPVDLPQIVVVGSQSSGKSSVLENIVGRDFLPRGSGIVTRRPLILQLINNGPESRQTASGEKEFGSCLEEYGEFLHKPGEKFFDFAEIRKEIIEETNRLTGQNKGISSQPISLRIYSPDVLNLTLVDLPGITKVPVGDQPSDIERQIREMILDYISNPNSIILAVSPANSDIANSDSLQMAMLVDPEGKRTIGVLTKIDLMDKGTDALEVLTGKVVPLKLGFIGVINRSQEDINSNKKISEALECEQIFFRRHLSYRVIASKLGTPYLAKTLNTLLIYHIQRSLPELKSRIEAEIADREKELNHYGKPPTITKAEKGAYLLNLISRFSNSFCDAIDGKAQHAQLGELHGGARISYIFHNVFDSRLMQIDPFEHLTDKEVRAAIRNASGPRPCLFVPEVSFELLVKSQIIRLEAPSLECVDLIYLELQKVAERSQTSEISCFSNLRDRISDGVSELLKSSIEPAKDLIRNVIQCELAYIKTSHPDFISGSKAVSESLEKLKRVGQETRTESNKHLKSSMSGSATVEMGSDQISSSPERSQFTDSKPHHTKFHSEFEQVIPDDLNTAEPTEREKIESEIIKTLISSYFNIIRKNVQDIVPKSIMLMMVNRCKECIQSHLVKSLYKDDLFDELLKENEDVTYKRNSCIELLTMLKKALCILNEIRELDASRL